MTVLLALLSGVLAYALGAFPTAYLAGRRARRVDIRSVGSGNPGALNAYRQLGKLTGSVVLAVDTGKGVLAIYVVRWIGAPDVALYSAAVAAVVGHNWSPFLQFRGGKGAAVVFGLSFAVLPLITAIAVPVTIVLLLASRNAVISMTGGFLILNGLTIGTLQPVPLILLCLLLTFMVAATHFVRQYPQLMPAMRRREWHRVTRIE